MSRSFRFRPLTSPAHLLRCRFFRPFHFRRFRMSRTKTFLIAASLALCATALADTGRRAPRDQTTPSAVLRVSIGSENATAVVVSKSGFVVTTSHFIDRSQGGATITVHDDGEKDIARDAIVVAIDKRLDLALLKADGPFPAEAVLADA